MHDCDEFSCIVNKGPLNVPRSCTKKVEAGLCWQKNSVTPTEAAQPQYALVLVNCVYNYSA